MKINIPILTVTLLYVCLWFCPAGAMGGTLSEKEIQDTYSQAKDLFRKANEAVSGNPQEAKELYKKAAMRFERLVRDGGIRNGKLHYNIGNTYFRMGDLGRAILHYRMAEQYTPNDPNLVQNLEYARSRRQDKIEERQQTKVLKTIFFWHYDLSPQTRSFVFACCFLAFWTGLSIRLFWRRAAPRWALVCLGMIAVLFLGSLVKTAVSHSKNTPGVILAEEITARKGDGKTYEPAFKEPLHAGTEFILIEKRSGWLQVELHDGHRCWLPQDSAALVKPMMLDKPMKPHGLVFGGFKSRNRPQRPLRNGRPADGLCQVEDVFLNLRGEAQEHEDSGDACSGATMSWFTARISSGSRPTCTPGVIIKT